MNKAVEDLKEVQRKGATIDSLHKFVYETETRFKELELQIGQPFELWKKIHKLKELMIAKKTELSVEGVKSLSKIFDGSIEDKSTIVKQLNGIIDMEYKLLKCADDDAAFISSLPQNEYHRSVSHEVEETLQLIEMMHSDEEMKLLKEIHGAIYKLLEQLPDQTISYLDEGIAQTADQSEKMKCILRLKKIGVSIETLLEKYLGPILANCIPTYQDIITEIFYGCEKEALKYFFSIYKDSGSTVKGLILDCINRLGPLSDLESIALAHKMVQDGRRDKNEVVKAKASHRSVKMELDEVGGPSFD